MPFFFCGQQGRKAMYQALYRKYRPRPLTMSSGRSISPPPSKTRSRRVAFPCLSVHRHPRDRQNHLLQNPGQSGQLPQPSEGNPCGVCDICRGIEDGSILDVVEIDAASNNGVDNIRDLRDEANFTPRWQSTGCTSSTRPTCSPPARSTPF